MLRNILNIIRSEIQRIFPMLTDQFYHIIIPLAGNISGNRVVGLENQSTSLCGIEFGQHNFFQLVIFRVRPVLHTHVTAKAEAVTVFAPKLYDIEAGFRFEGIVCVDPDIHIIFQNSFDIPAAMINNRQPVIVADIDDGAESGACDASYENATNGGAERVTYALDTNSGDLVRTIDCYNGTAWTTGVETSVVTQFLDVTSAVFRYYDANGGQLPSSSGGTLSASDRAAVVSVEIIFDLIDTSKTQLVGETNTNLFMSTRVRLHNITE